MNGRIVSLVALLCIALCAGLPAAEQSRVRIAVGPYFAPVQNSALQSKADVIPELLTAELSANERFQLVERAQVNAVVKELHLSAQGLTSAETVLKLGKLLSADWLISGTLATSQSGTQLWTKVIDLRSGVVIDLQAVLISKDLATSLIEVGSFLAKVGRPNAAPRQFVALGPFRDYSMAAGRPDWSRQLQFSLEKQFRERGFGVVDREAISFIAQELDLSRKGLTTPQTNRVKMEPAFWLVDGGSEWLGTAETNLSITLRMQKVGAAETMLRFTNAPGPVMDQAIRSGLSQAFLAADAVPAKGGAVDEGKIQAARGYELATGRNRLADPEYLNSARGDVQDARRDSRAMALQRYEAAVVLNPNDLESKFMLGYGLSAYPDTMERGRQLLWEIVRKNDPSFSQGALGALAMSELSEPDPETGLRSSFQVSDVAQQIILLTNATDLDAKFKLGSSLFGSPSERNQKRGRAYLTEVAASSRQDLALRAQELVVARKASPERLNAAQAGGSAVSRGNARSMVQSYEAAFALKPKDPEAKYNLGNALVAGPEGMERGKRLLWETVKEQDSKFSPAALRSLAMAELVGQGPPRRTPIVFRPIDIEQQMIVLTNSSDLDARFKLGEALLGYSSEHNRTQAVVHLSAVAASSRQDLAPLAKRALDNQSRWPLPPPAIRSPRWTPPPTVVVANDWRQKYELAVRYIAEVVPNDTTHMIGSLKHATNSLWEVVKKGDADLSNHAREAIAQAHDKYLWIALDRKDMNGVLEAIKNGARIESTNSYGQTPLIAAASKGRIEIAKILIGAGANVNAKSTTDAGSPVLCWAIDSNDPALLGLLIEKGATVDGRSRRGETALFSATANDRAKAVEFLLSKGADPDLECFPGKNGKLYSAIMWAEEKEDTATAALLKSGRTKKSASTNQ